MSWIASTKACIKRSKQNIREHGFGRNGLKTGVVQANLNGDIWPNVEYWNIIELWSNELQEDSLEIIKE